LVQSADAAAAPTSIPTITSPAFGAVIDTPSVTVKAESSAPFVQFDYSLGIGGGSSTVAVAGGEASLDIEVVGAGSLWVMATDCASAGTCSDSSTAGSWVVDLPDPVIVAPTAKQVVGSEVLVQVTAPGGSIAVKLDGRRKATDLAPPYEVTLSLAAKQDGTHDILVIQCNDDGSGCEGDSDYVKFVKDTVGPTWSAPKASRATVYPKDDQYLDVVTLSSRVSESVYGATVEVRKVDGPVVRTLNLGDRRSGVISRNWDGRNDGGVIVPEGRYEVRFIGADVNEVEASSEPGFVRVSNKELVRKTFTKQVTAVGSGIADISGDCSRVGRTSRWNGALGWRSNYQRTCSGSDAVAASVHGVRLDKLDRAVRYVSLQIDAYGGTAPQTRSQATMFYIKPNGDLAGRQALERSVRWHKGDKVALEPFVRRTKVRWGVATRNSNWYDIKGFRISYTVMVLQ
jgi:hypothetical protein